MKKMKEKLASSILAGLFAFIIGVFLITCLNRVYPPATKAAIVPEFMAIITLTALAYYPIMRFVKSEKTKTTVPAGDGKINGHDVCFAWIISLIIGGLTAIAMIDMFHINKYISYISSAGLIPLTALLLYYPILRLLAKDKKQTEA